jgi:hypothetical protein
MALSPALISPTLPQAGDDRRTVDAMPAQGDFARGQRHAPQWMVSGADFAAGQRHARGLGSIGTFATGMLSLPRSTVIGDFATGMRVDGSAPVILHEGEDAAVELSLAA